MALIKSVRGFTPEIGDILLLICGHNSDLKLMR